MYASNRKGRSIKGTLGLQGETSLENTILIIGAVLSFFAVLFAHLSSRPSFAIFFDNLHWTLSSGAATVAILIAWRKEKSSKKAFVGWCFAGFMAMFLGQCIYNVLATLGIFLIPDLSSPFFLLQVPLIAVGFTTLIKTSRDLFTALLDAFAFGLLLLSLVLIVYLPMLHLVPLPTFITLVAYPVEFFILAILGFVVALERREKITLPLLVLGGSPFVLGTLWTIWNANILQDNVPVASLVGDGFSLCYLVWAASLVNWQSEQLEDSNSTPKYNQIMNMLPIGLIIACAISLVFSVPANALIHDNVLACVIGALVISILRQSMLLRDRDKLMRSKEAAKLFREKLLQRQRLEILGTITSGVAHDMRNVLNVISGNAELISLANSNLQNKQYLNDISAASMRGQDIMQKILHFAKPQNKERHPFAAELLLNEVQRMLETALPKDHSIIINIEPNLPDLISNSSQLYQVLMNLAINASHALGDKNGEILIKLSKTEIIKNTNKTQTFLELTVEDTGSGMSEETLSLVFEPFFSTKPSSVGTGLGLSVVRDIILEHEGSIHINSLLGKGTTVTIHLPM